MSKAVTSQQVSGTFARFTGFFAKRGLHLVVTVTLATLLLMATASSAKQSTATVAVAANFTATAKALQLKFASQTGHKIKLSFGSTGKLYTQIIHGAPFDIFLSADNVRPAQLADKKLAVASSEFTYATGKLALYGQVLDARAEFTSAMFNNLEITKVAIANPKIAPYGAAALEVMQALQIYEQLKSKFVMGDNIAQTYQFTYTGNANLGFVALAQVVKSEDIAYLPIPDNLHTPLKQNAILLERGKNNASAHAFIDFLQTQAAKEIIAEFGYGI